MSQSISRRMYADLYGPTTGDRVRLADTDLILEVERDYTVYGDEIAFGGGKTIRDGMGQSSGALRGSTGSGALDLVITTPWSSIIGASLKATSASGMGVSSRSARPAIQTSWTVSIPNWSWALRQK